MAKKIVKDVPPREPTKPEPPREPGKERLDDRIVKR